MLVVIEATSGSYPAEGHNITVAKIEASGMDASVFHMDVRSSAW
jgi:hypothetical protein